jgi:hypothetical protein
VLDNPVLLHSFLLPRVGGWFAFFELLLSGRQISFLDNKDVFNVFNYLFTFYLINQCWPLAQVEENEVSMTQKKL